MFSSKLCPLGVFRLELGHYSRPSFMDNVTAAYGILSGQKGSYGSKGVSGNDFGQLLGMLCSDFSPQASNILLEQFFWKELESGYWGIIARMYICFII